MNFFLSINKTFGFLYSWHKGHLDLSPSPNLYPLSYDSHDKRNDSVYSQRIRAGKRRTYFFDIRATRGNDDFFLTITESRKRFDDNGYDRHKIFIYKEDFNKFSKALSEAVDHVKTELMPDFDFDAFSHEHDTEYEGQELSPRPETSQGSHEGGATRQDGDASEGSGESVDKW